MSKYSVIRISKWWTAKPSVVLQCCSFLTFRLLSSSPSLPTSSHSHLPALAAATRGTSVVTAWGSCTICHSGLWWIFRIYIDHLKRPAPSLDDAQRLMLTACHNSVLGGSHNEDSNKDGVKDDRVILEIWKPIIKVSSQWPFFSGSSILFFFFCDSATLILKVFRISELYYVPPVTLVHGSYRFKMCRSRAPFGCPLEWGCFALRNFK